MLQNNKKQYHYPKSWNDDDIIKFKYYLKQAKEMYDDLAEDLIELCCEHQIMEEKGLVQPIDYSKIEEFEINAPAFEQFNTVIET